MNFELTPLVLSSIWTKYNVQWGWIQEDLHTNAYCMMDTAEPDGAIFYIVGCCNFTEVNSCGNFKTKLISKSLTTTNIEWMKPLLKHHCLQGLLFDCHEVKIERNKNLAVACHNGPRRDVQIKQLELLGWFMGCLGVLNDYWTPIRCENCGISFPNIPGARCPNCTWKSLWRWNLRFLAAIVPDKDCLCCA